MQFSRDWLRQYLDLPEPAEEVAARLTALGLAVEGMEERDGDVLFDLDVTTNRPDCMHHLGVARELATVLDRPLRRPEVPAVGSGAASARERIQVRIENQEDCPRYAAVVVTGVTVGPSPDWLVERVEAIGGRSINSIVDITNFVLWETGQPLHAFDLATLRGGEIRVRRAAQAERLTTLDGEERQLDPSVLVIADRDRAVALAGVMGGADTEVGPGTQDVLIESAHFDRKMVRSAAKKLGLHTDASHRFERGADPEACLDAAHRAAALMAEVGGGTVLADSVDERPGGEGRKTAATLDLASLNAFAGVRIDADDAERWLAGLGFDPRPDGEGRLAISIPTWRAFDFELDADGQVYAADLYEEVLRLHGFDGIPSALPQVAGPDAGSSAGHRHRERIRDQLVACGFAEAINYAFYSSAEDARFAGLASEGPPLELANPLSEQFQVMRRSLVPGLLASARFNLNRGAAAVRLFEMGVLFPGGDSAEIGAWALIAGGGEGLPWDHAPALDLFDVKGAVESVAAAFDSAVESVSEPVAGLVEGTSSRLRIAGRTAGYMGQIDAADLAYPLFVAELEVAAFAGDARSHAVELPSRLPGVSVDLTLTHAVTVAWAEIAASIRAAEVADLRAFGLKDRYSGDGVEEGMVNTTIYFHYNSSDTSLTREQVNERHSKLAAELASSFGGAA